MEREVLGFRRRGIDVPGFLIPQMYMRYLQTRDAEPLSGVFYHNALDIVSLAVLYCHAAEILSGATDDFVLLLKAGDVWNQIGHKQRAREFWEMAKGSEATSVEASTRIAFLAKSEANYGLARDEFSLALERMTSGAARGANAVIFKILEELAKLEEHRFKSPEKALEYSKLALVWLRENRPYLGASYTAMSRAMTRRTKRLEKNIN
jgi:hypothetical protein